MRHLGIVASSAPQASAPTVTVSSVTNYNQNIATLNGTVSANGAITTTIKFQVSTDNSTWSDASGGTTITNTSSDNVSVYYNATGLSVGTLYYVRLVATNSAGTSNSSSTSFTTWALKSYTTSTVGTTSLSIPTVTPTGGSAVIPSILNAFVAAGGGGAGGLAAGGGGGVSTVGSRSFNNTSSLSLTITVGGGGAAGGANAGSAGGGSSISGSSFTTISATGGNGSSSGAYTASASSGNGNAAGAADYYYDAGSGQTPLSTEYYAAGGGGGAGAVGGNATDGTGGTGGNGVYSSTYSVGAGAGGGGGASETGFIGFPAQGAKGTYDTYGSGGSGGVIVDEAYTVSASAGGSGFVGIQYYGPP